VTVTPGAAVAPVVSITSTSGGIIQSGAGVITAPAVLNATTQSANFSAANGVALGNNNVIAVPVSITGGADSSIVNTAALTLGNVRVNGGTFTVNTSGSALAGGAVAQAAGTALSVYGNTSVTTRGSAITLANSGNNFGALTLSSIGGVGAAAGADIAVTEGSTLNVNAVNAGTTGKIALSSANASIIQTSTEINPVEAAEKARQCLLILRICPRQ